MDYYNNVIYPLPGHLLCVEYLKWYGNQSHHTHPSSQETRPQTPRPQMRFQSRL